jgi:DNA-binding response OmpR family regulator
MQSGYFQAAAAAKATQPEAEDLLPVTSRRSRVALLVVEDEFRMASFLKKRLSEHFPIVDCVTNCAGALDAVRQRSYLDVYMSRLRSKLQRSSGQSFFRTVRGIGYRLE